jgi:hypothetical protein
MYVDPDNNFCEVTTIIAFSGVYLTDVQIGQNGLSPSSISVIFVTNFGDDEKCGPVVESYTSLVPQDVDTEDNAILYFSAHLNDNEFLAPG